MPVESKLLGGLLGCAVGDAIGELAFSHPNHEAVLDAVSRRHPLRYTDDTAMTLAVAEALASTGDAQSESIGDALRLAYEREPWRGYGPGPPRIFVTVAGEGITYREAAQALYGGEGSLGNGAAMRVAPVGLFFGDHPQLYDKATASAVVTHTHPVGIDGAAVQAKAVAMAFEHQPSIRFDEDNFLDALIGFARTDAMGDKLMEVKQCVHEQTPPSQAIQRLGHSVAVDESLPFALYCFLRHHNAFSGCLHCAGGHGGDRDTMAAMACAVSGAYLGSDAIPETWRRDIENRDYIETMAQNLWDRR